MNAPKPPKNVIIIGAGPAGVLAALRLHRHNNIIPYVYEIRDEPTTLGGAIGIPSNGVRLLDRLQVWDALRARGAETSKLVMHGAQGHVMGHIDLTSWSREKTGFGYLRIRRTDLMEVLYEEARSAGIAIHFGKRLLRIEEHPKEVTATFADGTSATADFLLGCDGIHSAVRTLHVDPELYPEYSGVSNVYSLLSTTALRGAPESLDGLNTTLTADGLFALSPCTPRGDMLYWFFSREIPVSAGENTRDGWEERGKAELGNLRATLLDLIRDSEGEWGTLLRDVIDHIDMLKFYPIFKLPLGGRWSRGRCLLIGDSAHAMPPHASQGVSMALEDVFLLSNLLAEPRQGLEDVFDLFESKRRPRVNEMIETAERNGKMRQRVGPWRLWFTELALSGALTAYSLLSLHKLGLGQKSLVYDIEQEVSRKS